MISTALWLVVVFFGAGCIVWGAEKFAEHLAAAGKSLGVSTFVLALLLAGAEPEELATCLTASVRKLPASLGVARAVSAYARFSWVGHRIGDSTQTNRTRCRAVLIVSYAFFIGYVLWQARIV